MTYLDNVAIWIFWAGIQFILTGSCISLLRQKNWKKALLLGFMAVAWFAAFVLSEFYDVEI